MLLVAMAACISEFLAVAAAAAMVESLAACLEFLMLHVAVVAVASMGDGFAASREFLVLYVSLATVAATDEVLCCISGCVHDKVALAAGRGLGTLLPFLSLF